MTGTATDSPWSLGVVRGPAPAGLPSALGGTLTIGRSAECGLRLPDPSVSRHHAELTVDAEGCSLVDLGSRHGTTVNSLRLAANVQQKLRAGDRIGIGPWLFQLASSAANSRPRFEASDHTVRIRSLTVVGDLAGQRLTAMLNFARDLGLQRDEHDLLDALCRTARQTLGYERAAVISDREPTPAVCAIAASSESALRPYSTSLIAATRDGQPAELEALAGDALSASLVGVPVQHALCVPLDDAGPDRRCLYLDASAHDRRQSEGAALAIALARIGAVALSHLSRSATELQRARLDGELQQAREAQQRLLPPATGRHGSLEYALSLKPGGHVAGDLADVFATPTGTAVVIGDVSGSGASAGLVMAAVLAHLRASLAHESDIAAAARTLNIELCRWLPPGRFVTAWIGLFQPDGTVLGVDAGHGHVMHLDPTGAIRAGDFAGHAPFGVLSDTDYRAEALRLEPGHALFLYTDGAIEVRDADGGCFGEDRLKETLARCVREGLPVIEQVEASIQQHLGTGAGDDQTLLWLRRGPQHPRAPDPS